MPLPHPLSNRFFSFSHSTSFVVSYMQNFTINPCELTTFNSPNLYCSELFSPWGEILIHANLPIARLNSFLSVAHSSILNGIR
ncbi:hypothetical protein CW304_18915 [Bacillus sp. UFRGS-B20]|nr:hypothetical protein CW304_18915 [Bacillus sp. UFRGS-B20]